MWSVVSGSSFCAITQGGACVTDGTDNYGNDESCTVRAEVAITVSAQGSFETEATFDYVTIGGTQYSGTNGPVSVWL
jgi:hypothetical protein